MWPRRWGGSDSKPGASAITNRIAIFLALAIVAFLVVDFLVFERAMSLFLARKFVDLIDLVAFWR